MSSTRDFAAPAKKRGPGRPPNVKGKGGPAYVPSNNNRPGTNNNSPVQTPPRSPSEASLASNQELASDGMLSPLNSPPSMVTPPLPVPQQLPATPQPRTLPPTPLAGLKTPLVVPPTAKQPSQPIVAANVASPPGQDLMQLQDRVNSLAESNRRHGILLQENSTTIRQIRESIAETTRLLYQLVERNDHNPSPSSGNVRSAPASRSNNYSTENNTNVRPNNVGSNAQNPHDSNIRRVIEDKHIPPAITMIKSPVNDDIVSWIEKLQSIARNQQWTDADIRQVFLFRTGGALNNFLFKDLDISTMTFTQIVDAIFQKWNNIDRLMINTQKLQNTRMKDGETVEEYYERFIEVAARVTNKSDFDKMVAFIDGLTEELREQMVKNAQPKDLDSAYTSAQNAESWKSLFRPKKSLVKKETIYQIVRPINPQRPSNPGSYNANFNAPSPGNFNSPKPFSPKPPSTPYPNTPKTPAPTNAHSKFNNSSAVRRLNFGTPQHNNIEEVTSADEAVATDPQAELNNVEDTYYIVDDGAPEPGNDLLEEH